MLPEINEIAAQKDKPTEEKNTKFLILMNYAHTYYDIIICYYARNMWIHINSDAAHLVQLNAKSRESEHFYLSNKPTSTIIKPSSTDKGAILKECNILKLILPPQQK